jgi:hypothetical protein
MITSPRAETATGAGSLKGSVLRGGIEEEWTGNVSGFDEEYESRMAEAQGRARAQGRGDVLEYLSLRASNDSVRARAVEWLLDSFMTAAGELNRAGAGLTLARTDSHRFRVGTSTMVGTRLTLSRGLRSLTVEAGWPRAPRDGIVRGGGLASARAGHFGERKSDEEFLLVPSGLEEARWLVLDKTGARTELLEERLRAHVARLLK